MRFAHCILLLINLSINYPVLGSEIGHDILILESSTTHTTTRTVGRTPLDGRSALRRDFYLTTYNTQNRQISMPAVGFET
jgi:hypothetical protein